MEPKEIAWLVEVCASTNAELGETWGRLQRIVRRLEEDQAKDVLYHSGLWRDHEQVQEALRQTVQGLDLFLQIQEAYLYRIREEQELRLNRPPLAPLEKPALLQPVEDVNTPAVSAIPTALAPTWRERLTANLLEYYRFTPAEATLWLSQVNYVDQQPTPTSLAVTERDVWLNRVDYHQEG